MDKLERKHQKILRELLKQPENKTCFDCTEKGPFYACTTFGTFVCPTCSGIHREFGHRVKSISMATFKPEEVAKLQSMGNGRAKEIWLNSWSPADFPEPDSTDRSSIREFMKLKYEEKKWYKKKRSEKNPKLDNKTKRQSHSKGQNEATSIPTPSSQKSSRSERKHSKKKPKESIDNMLILMDEPISHPKPTVASTPPVTLPQTSNKPSLIDPVTPASTNPTSTAQKPPSQPVPNKKQNGQLAGLEGFPSSPPNSGGTKNPWSGQMPQGQTPNNPAPTGGHPPNARPAIRGGYAPSMGRGRGQPGLQPAYGSGHPAHGGMPPIQIAPLQHISISQLQQMNFQQQQSILQVQKAWIVQNQILLTRALAALGVNPPGQNPFGSVPPQQGNQARMGGTSHQGAPSGNQGGAMPSGGANQGTPERQALFSDLSEMAKDNSSNTPVNPFLQGGMQRDSRNPNIPHTAVPRGSNPPNMPRPARGSNPAYNPFAS